MDAGTGPRVDAGATGVALPGDDEVLRALLRRRDGRRDAHRIALVVGGGGMRGAYAGGMVHALQGLDLSGGFDVVYGSSVGASWAPGCCCATGATRP